MRDAAVAKGDKSRELKLRVASAVVMAPVVIGLTWIGGMAFAALMVVAAIIMANEWATIVLGRSRRIERIAGLGFVGAAVALQAVALEIGRGAAGGLAAAAAVVAACGFAVAEARGQEAARVRWAPWGPIYAAAPAIAFDVLRAAPNGAWLILYLFAVVWATDIFAYFTGRSLGGPKLWPAVSPNKTWSGAIGGLVAGAVFGAAAAHLGGAPGMIGPGVAAVLLSVASQAGDLFESSLKRRFGVKDSGRLLPGHGGLLDRVDGLVAAAVAAALVAAATGGTGPGANGPLVW